jgi:hypothetical protein
MHLPNIAAACLQCSTRNNYQCLVSHSLCKKSKVCMQWLVMHGTGGQRSASNSSAVTCKRKNRLLCCDIWGLRLGHTIARLMAQQSAVCCRRLQPQKQYRWYGSGSTNTH